MRIRVFVVQGGAICLGAVASAQNLSAKFELANLIGLELVGLAGSVWPSWLLFCFAFRTGNLVSKRFLCR